jgi:hypothetical protein
MIVVVVVVVVLVPRYVWLTKKKFCVLRVYEWCPPIVRTSADQCRCDDHDSTKKTILVPPRSDCLTKEEGFIRVSHFSIQEFEGVVYRTCGSPGYRPQNKKTSNFHMQPRTKRNQSSKNVSLRLLTTLVPCFHCGDDFTFF